MLTALSRVLAAIGCLTTVLSVASVAAQNVRLGVLTQACAATSTAVRDSAGVKVLENDVQRLPVVDLRATRVVRVGGIGASPGSVFGRVLGAAFIQKEYIAIADSLSSRVGVFTPTGRMVHAFGQEGGGPGDFQALTAIRTSVDGKLLAVDQYGSRLTYFELAGAVSRVRRLPASAFSSAIGGRVVHGTGRTVFLGEFQDGRLLVLSRVNPPSNSSALPKGKVTVQPRAGELVWTDSAGAISAQRIPIKEFETFVYISPQGMLVDGRVPFSASFSALVHDNDSWLSADGQGDLVQRTSTGVVRRISRLCQPQWRLSKSDADRVKRAFVEASHPTIKRNIEAAMRQLDLRAPVPRVVKLVGAAGREFWVMHATLPGAPRMYTVVTWDGRATRRIRLAANEDVLAVGASHVVSRLVGDDGEEVVLIRELPY